MKLFEMMDQQYLGFRLEQREEHEEDNSKIWHTIILPGGKRQTLDHSPYEWIDPETFRMYVLFIRHHNRIPTRDDINSNGPIHKEDLEKL